MGMKRADDDCFLVTMQFSQPPLLPHLAFLPLSVGQKDQDQEQANMARHNISTL